jgi:hypothetical protein
MPRESAKEIAARIRAGKKPDRPFVVRELDRPVRPELERWI